MENMQNEFIGGVISEAAPSFFHLRMQHLVKMINTKSVREPVGWQFHAIFIEFHRKIDDFQSKMGGSYFIIVEYIDRLSKIWFDHKYLVQ